MASSSARWLYFGNFPQIDTVETNYGNENVSAVLTTADKTTLQAVVITANDIDDSGLLLSDDNGQVQETFSYNLGAGPITIGYDSEAIVNVTVTLGDGSSFAAVVTLYQMDNGDVFLFEPDVFDFKNIQFVTITSQISDNYNGTTTPLIADGEVDEVQIVCFAGTVRIATPGGEVDARDLKQGDLVTTLDHGPQPVRWIGSRHLSTADLAHNPALRPVRIAAGALGDGRPCRDLLVSPQHRILVSSPIVARMFNAPEVLVAAKHLLGIDGIEVDHSLEEVTYVHILFDRHEVLTADGAATESLYTGPQALRSVGHAARNEIIALLPHLNEIDVGIIPSARPAIAGRFGRRLAIRHAENRHLSLQTGMMSGPEGSDRRCVSAKPCHAQPAKQP